MSNAPVKNILFIHHVSCLAGAEQYLVSVIKALDKRYKIFFICQEPGPLTAVLENMGVTVQCMPLRAWRKPRYLLANIKTIWDVTEFCRKHRIDAVCSNNYRVASYAVWPAKMLRIPSVVIIQDFASSRTLWKFNTFQADALITVSKSLKATVKQFRRKVVHIYNGLDVQAFDKSAGRDEILKKEFPDLRGKRVVGMVAHIIPLKGHKLFLDAMQKVARRFNDVMFVVIGDSPNKEQLSLQDIKVYAKDRGIADRLTLTGARPDVPALLKSFDILVHPSEKEAFGRVIMEAMALRVPVVATACGGPSEIIEDGQSGFLIPVGDETALTKAVETLLTNADQRAAIATAGRRRIEEHFTISRTVGTINDFFDGLLKGKNHS